MNSDMAFMFMGFGSMAAGMIVMYIWMKYGK
jgi:hypothetical protein